jgi:hypothetical protein
MPPLFGKLRRLWGGRGWVELKAAQPMSTTIGQIEFELEKAEHGMGYPMTPSRSSLRAGGGLPPTCTCKAKAPLRRGFP